MSQRLDLREFQQSLAERLLAAQQGERGESLLEIESGTDDLPGGRHWLADPAQSGEIAPLPSLTSVPLTQPWFAGIANIRGTLFSVVDFAAWRGGQATPRTAQSRLLLIGARDGSHSALLVERVLGLRTMDNLQAQAGANGTAQNNAAQTVWQGTCFTDAQSRVAWTCLDIPALLATPAYLDIAL
jgi:twitching motility protein PilI